MCFHENQAEKVLKTPLKVYKISVKSQVLSKLVIFFSEIGQENNYPTPFEDSVC